MKEILSKYLFGNKIILRKFLERTLQQKSAVSTWLCTRLMSALTESPFGPDKKLPTHSFFNGKTFSVQRPVFIH